MLSTTQSLQSLFNVQAEEATVELGDRLISLYYKNSEGIEFGKQYELPEKLKVPAMGAVTRNNGIQASPCLAELPRAPHGGAVSAVRWAGSPT